MIATNTVIDFTIDMTPGASSEAGPVWVDFKVYDVVGWTVDKPPQPLYDRGNGEIFGVPVQFPGEAQIFCHGRIKWDGCCDLYFDEQDVVMLHGCCRRDMTRLGALMDVLYTTAAEIMNREEELA